MTIGGAASRGLVIWLWMWHVCQRNMSMAKQLEMLRPETLRHVDLCALFDLCFYAANVS